MTTLSNIGEAVRRFDNDRYVCALFAPDAAREALFALYGFNIEIAKTREAVSEPMLGQIRLQWWREAIGGIYAGTPRAHEVVEALAAAVAAHDLPREPLDALIDAREADLEDAPTPDMDALIDYARATTAPLNALAAAALSAAPPPESDGTAQALTGLLRAIPFHARARRQYLPAPLLKTHGGTVTDYMELRPTDGLCNTVLAVADTARALLREAEGLGGSRAAPFRAQSQLVKRQLRQIARAGHNPFDARLQRRAGPLDLFALWRAAS